MKNLSLILLVGSLLSGCCVVGRLSPHGTYYQTKVCYCAVSYPFKSYSVPESYAADFIDYQFGKYSLLFYPVWLVELPVQSVLDTVMWPIDRLRYKSYVKKIEYEHQVQQREYLRWMKDNSPKQLEEYLKRHPEDRYLVD